MLFTFLGGDDSQTGSNIRIFAQIYIPTWVKKSVLKALVSFILPLLSPKWFFHLLLQKIFSFAAMHIDKDIKEQEKENEEKTEEAN